MLCYLNPNFFTVNPWLCFLNFKEMGSIFLALKITKPRSLEEIFLSEWHHLFKILYI